MRNCITMRGLKVSYSLGRADIVRLGYFAEAYHFNLKKVPAASTKEPGMIITDSVHPIEDVIDFLINSGCKDVVIETKNEAHFTVLKKEFKDKPVTFILNKGVKNENS